MIKLTKTSSAQWQGNGFGISAAEWVVKGKENISIRKLSTKWVAVDTNEYAIVRGRKVVKKVATAWDKATLIEILEAKI